MEQLRQSPTDAEHTVWGVIGCAAHKASHGFAIAEVVVAAALLVVTSVAGTAALLRANRTAALARVVNAAKAEALSRIQEVSQCAFAPDALPPVIPTVLNIGTTTTAVDLGSPATDLKSIPGTLTWTVAAVPGAVSTRSARCTVNYQYLGRTRSYELYTFKSAD